MAPCSFLDFFTAGLLFAGVGRQEVPGVADDMIQRAALSVEEPLAEANTLPDVVLISIDTLRADAVLFEDVPMPNFDCLRKRGRWSPYGLGARDASIPTVRRRLRPAYFARGTHSTGMSAWRNTDSATEPNTRRRKPVRPCVLMMIRSQPWALA